MQSVNFSIIPCDLSFHPEKVVILKRVANCPIEAAHLLGIRKPDVNTDWRGWFHAVWTDRIGQQQLRTYFGDGTFRVLQCPRWR